MIYPLQTTGLLEADPGLRPVGAPRCAEGCTTCETNEDVLAYIVGLLRDLPNTWGYYLADEPKAGEVSPR